LIQKGDIDYSYDKDGNLLSEKGLRREPAYQYNGANRMVYSEVTSHVEKNRTTSRYAYDALGRRMRRRLRHAAYNSCCFLCYGGYSVNISGAIMSKYEKLIQSILSGRQDMAFKFSDLTKLLCAMGFQERIKGSHHIYYRLDIEEILNIQPNGSNAKPYQVKQVRNVIIKYGLEVRDE
jgi:YD repeat-containing protein